MGDMGISKEGDIGDAVGHHLGLQARVSAQHPAWERVDLDDPLAVGIDCLGPGLDDLVECRCLGRNERGKLERHFLRVRGAQGRKRRDKRGHDGLQHFPLLCTGLEQG